MVEPLLVQGIVIHDIPHKSKNERTTSLRLSEVESPLNEDIKRYFQEKIREAANSSRAFRVSWIEGFNDSPIRAEVEHYFDIARYDSLVPISHTMAKHLYEIQTGSNPAGLLGLMHCTMVDGQTHALACLKVERSRGTQILPTDVQGHPTFQINVLKNLMLHDASRVFKLALFINRPNNMEILVVDNQVGWAHKRNIAQFFLRDFLGCHLLDAPDILTQKFYDAVERFINEVVDDPEKKVEYTLQLVAELKNQSDSINPEQFAIRCFSDEYRGPFQRFIIETGIPYREFPKDLGQIQSRLRRRIVEFESGISLSGSEDALRNKVSIQKQDNGLARIEFEDKIERVIGK